MTASQPYLTVQDLPIAPVPQPDGVPFWDLPWIDPVLEDRLFGKIADATPKTYLIVDAILRKQLLGGFDLDVVPLRTQCLYNGQAAEDYAEHAPYLIDLTLPEKGPSPFRTSFFREQWDAGTGILLRSNAEFDDIRTHFRKFTRTVNADGRAMMFRFWETNMLRDYFGHLAHAAPSRAKEIFQLRSGLWVDLIVGHAEALGRTYAISPDKDALANVPRNTDGFRLSRAEADALYRGVIRSFAVPIAHQQPETIGDLEAEDRVFDCLMRMRGYGIVQLDHLAVLAAWELSAPEPFEARDAALHAILTQDLPEADKMQRLQDARAALTA